VKRLLTVADGKKKGEILQELWKLVPDESLTARRWSQVVTAVWVFREAEHF